MPSNISYMGIGLLLIIGIIGIAIEVIIVKKVIKWIKKSTKHE